MNQLIEFINYLSQIIPVDIFAFVGSVLEELIAPIPSPLVMTLAGTLVKANNMPFIYLIWIAVLASAGKTLASLAYYLVADHAEDLVFTKYGSYIGVTHDNIESIGKRFNGSWHDDFVLITARALPFMPTSVVSAVCGFIKLNKNTFIRATFIGYIFRSFLFLYFGFIGLKFYGEIEIYIASIESWIKYVFVIVTILVVTFSVYKIIKYKIKNKLQN